MNQIHVVYVIYKITSVTSVNLKSFWSSTSNKVASTNFLQKSFLKEIDVILSGYMIDVYGVYLDQRIVAGVVIEDPELWRSYCRSIKSKQKGLLLPTNTSVAIFSLEYHQRFCELRVRELWVKFGIEDGSRNILNHKVRQQLVREKSSALLKAYIVTGCDETRY